MQQNAHGGENNGGMDTPVVHIPPDGTNRRPFARIGTVNIRAAGWEDEWANLDAICRDADEMGCDILVLTEVKIRSDAYQRRMCGFRIYSSTDAGEEGGGVAVIIRENMDGWKIEDQPQILETNVLAFTYVSGKYRRRIVGVYLSPSQVSNRTTAALEQALDDATDPVLLMGDLNADLRALESPRVRILASLGRSLQQDGHDTTLGDERNCNILALLASHGLQDLARTGKQRRRTGGVTTWFQRRTNNTGVQVTVRAACDYVLGSLKGDPVRRHRIRHVNHTNTDHRMVYIDLSIRRVEHQRLERRLRKFPKESNGDRNLDRQMAEILKLQPRTEKKERETVQPWISNHTWGLMKERNDLRRIKRRLHGRELRRLKELRKLVSKGIRTDRTGFLDRAAHDISMAMQNDVKRAWQLAQKWYKRAANVPLPMSRQESRKVETEYAKLYSKEVIEEELWTLPDLGFEVFDGELDKEELRKQAKRLKPDKAPGATKLRNSTLKEWAHAEEGTPGAKAFDKVFELCAQILRTGKVPSAFLQGILVLIPKSERGKYRGITLLDTIYKLLSTVILKRAEKAITWHDSLHGFRTQRGCNTAIAEVKLNMQARLRSIKPYHMVFLDLSKAYDTVDWERLDEILEAYGFGPRLMAFLRATRGGFVVPRSGGNYGRKIQIFRGVRQGDPLSVLLFNCVADAVTREVDRRFNGQKQQLDMVLYADDKFYGSEDPEVTMDASTTIAKLFATIGLRTNVEKTESMTLRHSPRAARKHPRAIYHMQEGRPGYTERVRNTTECEHCGVTLQIRSYNRHVKTQHPEILWNDFVRPGIWSPAGATTDPDHTRLYTVLYQKETFECPFPKCQRQCRYPSVLHRHWADMHWPDKVEVLGAEEPTNQCVRCNLFLHKEVDDQHSDSAWCRQIAKKRERERRIQDVVDCLEAQVNINGKDVKRVNKFKYLGRQISSDNSDFAAVQANIIKANCRWGELRRILKSKKISRLAHTTLYKVVVQAILLYGCESWELTPKLRSMLDAFHHRCCRYIAGKHIRPVDENDLDGEWIHPSTEEILNELGLERMSVYIEQRRQKLQESYLNGRPSVEQRSEQLDAVRRNLGEDLATADNSDLIESMVEAVLNED